MKITAFQYMRNEPLGLFDTFFSELDVPYDYAKLYETNKVLVSDTASYLIFLGGPMSVNNDEEYPYIIEKKQVIRSAVKRGIRVLGICLGAQLIASAFGGDMCKHINEIGWSVFRREPVYEGIFSTFPDRFPFFHFYQKTFELPYGANLLCTGTVVKNQAFSYRNALGLQFHLELNGQIIHDLTKGVKRYIQEKDCP